MLKKRHETHIISLLAAYFTGFTFNTFPLVSA